MSQIKVVPLGAGQDVGRSCVVVTLGNKNIMFDCGMHMGYNDERRFPDFSYLSKNKNFDNVIDCVIISHFHLDHCGALPHFTEMLGYNGPILMTHPTKAICPILLEDYRKITVERKGETNFFTSQMIKDCMKKVTAVNINETTEIEEDFEVRAYYAGHVLGAAMFYVRVGSQSVVYTGDYNMTPDRHLGGASIEKLRPNLLITETTYATTIRDSKRIRERDFLKRVHETVEKGGKVLIPVFALGRAQELCILIDAYWERMNLNVPIYFSAGLTEKANMYYKLFINWTNQKIKNTFVKRNMFDFKHIKPFERSFADRPGPMVLFATPGMLHAGTSLEVFKKWCTSENNMCILPGYCVVGTVGNKILTQSNVTIDIDKKTKVDVKCQVKSLSFSAHADAKGIMQLIRQCCPDNVMLVHGEKAKMEFLQQRIINEFKTPCYSPANGCTLVINPASNTESIANMIPVEASNYLIEQQFEHDDFDDDENEYDGPRGIGDFEDLFRSEFLESMMEDGAEENLVQDLPTGELTAPINAVIVANKPLDDANVKLKLLDINEASREIGLPQHSLRFNSTVTLNQSLDKTALLNKINEELKSQKVRDKVSEFDGSLSLRSIEFKLHELAQNKIKMSWLYEDEDLADFILSALNK